MIFVFRKLIFHHFFHAFVASMMKKNCFVANKNILLLLSLNDRKMFGLGGREKKLLAVKNCDRKLHTVQFLSPEPPFYVDNASCSISGGHYVRLPVSVRVSRNAALIPPGSYSSILVIKSISDNITFPVHLSVNIVP